MVERTRLATVLDRELQRACRAEASGRRRVGVIAREVLCRRAYRRLGFVRLSDYARERLGVSASALEGAARIATRLEALPRIAAAFGRGELSWTQVRVLCAVAGPENEAEWLFRARGCTVDELAAVIERERAATVGAAAPVPDREDDLLDGEPPVRLRIACPGRVRCLWRYALELARRVAGEQLAAWRAAEIIAAEGIAGRPEGTAVGDRVLLAFMRLKRRLSRSAEQSDERRTTGDVSRNGKETGYRGAHDAAASGPSVWSCRESAAESASVSRRADSADPDSPILLCGEPLVPSADDLASCDALALDARLYAAVRAAGGAEPRIGHLLRTLVDHGLYRALGFSSTEGYVRERLGISLRKAWALIKIEKTARRVVAFREAYEGGTVSWVRALTLLPVVDRATADDWIARANAVTVRRLIDEVNSVLDARDTFGPDIPLSPPPLDSVLVSPALAFGGDLQQVDGNGRTECRKLSPDQIVQIGARVEQAHGWAQYGIGGTAAAEVCDGEIAFTGPASVAALFRDALDVFQRPGAPRWVALESLLRRVIADWKAEPRHRDPVFARDGWCCLVPACSSRRNLEDHHIRFRSRGGGNELTNRSAICVGHHLHGIHAGVIQASGRAPAGVYWQLGVRSDAPPFLTFIGDRLIRGPT